MSQQGEKGGDCILQTGAGGAGKLGFPPGSSGSFIFRFGGGVEFMRCDPDGTVTIRGEKVDNNLEIYKAVKSWFLGCSVKLEGNALSSNLEPIE